MMVGGNLSVATLLQAYAMGIFPWYDASTPILWWCPDPRFAMTPEELHIPHNLRKTLKKRVFTVTYDQDFQSVISACSRVPRQGQSGTWITAEMVTAYQQLHAAGFAHSVEVWRGGRLVGGLYGVAIGQAFFGESMFHLENDASKVAFVHLVDYLRAKSYTLIDCQQPTELLARLGASEWSRDDFLDALQEAVSGHTRGGKWG